MNRHLVLFLLTVLTCTAAGAGHYAGFISDFGRNHAVLSWVQLAVGGLWFSGPFLGFLTALEFGHYFVGRWHGLRPSLPYYLPAPLPITGSLGAVIVFRGHFPDRRVLFDFAAGGPLAGFVVAVIALGCGLAWSPVVKLPQHFEGVWMGEPLLYQWMSDALAGSVPDGSTLNLHPTALAGWLGLLFTMMNLVPISQLDGGHIAYAVVRRHSRWLTIAGLVTLAVFILWLKAYSWSLWLVLLLVIMRIVGWEHPASLDDDLPIGTARLLLAVVLVAIFVLCFMPVPLSPIELIGGH
jgi:membrane-associated protease RseP (regulator of RpoE activity)